MHRVALSTLVALAFCGWSAKAFARFGAESITPFDRFWYDEHNLRPEYRPSAPLFAALTKNLALLKARVDAGKTRPTRASRAALAEVWRLTKEYVKQAFPLLAESNDTGFPAEAQNVRMLGAMAHYGWRVEETGRDGLATFYQATSPADSPLPRIKVAITEAASGERSVRGLQIDALPGVSVKFVPFFEERYAKHQIDFQSAHRHGKGVTMRSINARADRPGSIIGIHYPRNDGRVTQLVGRGGPGAHYLRLSYKAKSAP